MSISLIYFDFTLSTLMNVYHTYLLFQIYVTKMGWVMHQPVFTSSKKKNRKFKFDLVFFFKFRSSQWTRTHFSIPIFPCLLIGCGLDCLSCFLFYIFFWFYILTLEKTHIWYLHFGSILFLAPTF